MKTVNHFIDGKIFSDSKSRKGPIFNPAIGEQIAEVELASKATVEKAIESSSKAFLKWSKTTPISRSRILSKYKDLLIKNMEELAVMVSEQHGKTIADAKGSIQRGIEVVEYATGITDSLKGDHSSSVGTNVDSHTLRQPIGVCAGITPFNFPAMVPMWMYPISIACGNTFVLKPSEKDPSCPMRLAEIAIEAGLPAGVLNVVNGDKEAVDTLLENKTVQAISFVGSTPIAEYVYHTGTKNNKRVQALGGAKNHMLSMEDANLEDAVNGLIGAAFGSAGERCMATSVAIPIGKIQKPFMELLKEKTSTIKVGESLDPLSEMGPLITKEHKQKVLSYIEKGIAEGADLEMDGRKISLQGFENGNFVGPTIFNNVKTDMTIYKEEIFGPVLSVVNLDDFEKAMSVINEHKFGNGTSIYTSNGTLARNFMKNVQIGMVGINIPIPVPMAFYSFGGWKGSIFGGHGMHGEEGINFYTKRKTITSRWPDDVAGASLNMPTMK